MTPTEIGELRFEKWQALGNDYLIVEREQLPIELTPARIRKLCAPHFGVGADGVLVLSRSDDPAFVARLWIHNPDGSEAELSGNGAREAVLYLRRHGWTEEDVFSIQTAAGTITPTILSPHSCRVDMGAASLTSASFPGGAEDGHGELTAGGRRWRFQHVAIGNPQCAIHVEDLHALLALDLPAVGPAIEAHELFPHRTNVCWYTETEPGPAHPRIRARIFERGVGETLSSGTGATGAAVAYVLARRRTPPAPDPDAPRPPLGATAHKSGLHEPVTVTVALDGGELQVEVGEELHVQLTGWARPVHEGRLSDDFVKELYETE
ncbi:MAG TPA: diaminopimelate epimerase [Solirubrobacteraceae bacterium]|jgi:diaminopimelate epimerase|nr:diaminopimelate epimerase [Solirubrobacteraceae bacterium]